MHGTPNKSVVVLVIICFISTPLVSAGYSDWSLTVPINPDDDGVTISGFSVPSDETVTDGWINVDSIPMANAPNSNIVIEDQGLDSGTFDGTTTSLMSGSLSLIDDETLTEIDNFDVDSSFLLNNIYFQGPGFHLFEFEHVNPSTGDLLGYHNHPSCTNLTGTDLLIGYNLSSGIDSDGDGILHSSEVTQTVYLCQTDQIIQNGSGSGNLGSGQDYNGTLQNGTFTYYTIPLPSGHSSCPLGGTNIVYGNDFSMYYDHNTSLNATEEDGELFFCDPIDADGLWEPTDLDLGGVIISGDQQQLAHGIVPSSPYDGAFVIGTKPGAPLNPSIDHWFVLPSMVVPDSPLQSSYNFTFNHWYHIDNGDAAWIEYRTYDSTLDWSDWSWVAPEGGYPNSVTGDVIDDSTYDISSTMPVFGGNTASGWINSEFNVSNIVSSIDTNIQFRFRIATSSTSTGFPGWFIDDINYRNGGAGSSVWHHGCDVNGTYYQLYGNSCYYSPSATGVLDAGAFDLTGVSNIEFDLHWDLEGSIWDNACIEVRSAGNSWYDITSNGNGGSTTLPCRSRTGPIPGNGYSDMDGQTHGDDSGGLVTIDPVIPTAYQTASTEIRFVVTTDSSVQWGGTSGNSDPDKREGLTVFGFRTISSTGSTLSSHYLPSSLSPTGTDWQQIQISSGAFHDVHDFEDTIVSPPSIDDGVGFSRTTSIANCANSDCRWELTAIMSDNFGPQQAASFPYLYSVGSEGTVVPQFDEISLITPTYSVPNAGVVFFTFDQWICAYYTGSYGNYRGSALFIQVDNGNWQHVDPGNWYSGTMATQVTTPSYISTVVDGLGIWTNEDCNNGEFTTYELPLDNWGGSDVRFKFSMGGKYSYSPTNNVGWFVDNVGVRNAHFSSSGSWTSQPFSVDGLDEFNKGIIEVEGVISSNSSLTGTLISSFDSTPIIGFEDLEFPINLAGLSTSQSSGIQLKLNFATLDDFQTPIIHRIVIGDSRILSGDLYDFNGWTMSSGVEVVDGLLNATTVSGTITSDYIDSIRPINRLNFLGNASNNVAIEVFDVDGVSIGTTTQGGYVQFSEPIMGYSLSVSLLPSSYINRMTINHIYAEPARDIVIDVAEDTQSDWAFPYSSGFGHLGWQTNILQYSPSSPSIPSSPMTSIDLQLDAGVSETVFMLIPASSVVNSGIIALTSDSDGFDAPIDVTINGYQKSTLSSDMYLSYLHLSANQVASMIALTPDTLTDSANNRIWKEVNIEFESSLDQSITLSRIAVSYSLVENVSGLAPVISAYHDSAVIANPSLSDIYIPTNITAAKGQILIDGRVLHELMITNKHFTVPNTFYPDGIQSEIVTTHRHLYDNSELVSITLEAISSEGDTILFSVENGADGAWGQDSSSDPVNFYQSSGSELSTLDTSSSHVNIIDGGDGRMDVEVTWAFDTSWNWDDVDSIDWYSNATNSAGEFWSLAHAASGIASKAVENDLVLESVLIKDEFDRVISNPSSPIYPYPVRPGSLLNVSGVVSFEGSTPPVFPQSIDFDVSGNVTHSAFSIVHPLTSMTNGEFYGHVPVSASDANGLVNAEITRVGPISGSSGAESLGDAEVFSYEIDSNPPGLGPLEIQTSSGLIPANGEVWGPTIPLDIYVTVSDSEAIGETLTLHYWREGLDDNNGDNIADAEEYQNLTYYLNSGYSGEQQVIFNGIDVNSLEFNSDVHFWIEGTDWAGLSYQDGMRGGGPGAENSWGTLVIATDIEATIVKNENAFSIDHQLGYLLAGNTHNFKMQIYEPNGIQTLDSVTIMLCGLRMDGNLGGFHYSPTLDELSTTDDSMVTPHSVAINQISTDVIELSFMVEISWNFPFVSGDSCSPYVKIDDYSASDEYNVGNNIQGMTWYLDNVLTAVPLSTEDLTPPHVLAQGDEIYLRQGDEYSVAGTIEYSGSGASFIPSNENLQVEMQITYGTQVISSLADVDDVGSWYSTMVLPMRQPLTPTMGISIDVLNIPGEGQSLENTDLSIIVDSNPPRVDWLYDSSLSVLDSDRLIGVDVAICIDDEIGISEADGLDVYWYILRGGLLVSGTEGYANLPFLITHSADNGQVFQDELDFRPSLEGFEIQEGDKIMFSVLATDRAGNEMVGSGSENDPRVFSLRIMEFNPVMDRYTISDSFPYQDSVINITTFWSNDGMRDGEITVNLYEMKDDGSWVRESPDKNLQLDPKSTSTSITFQWTAGDPGIVPILYVIVNDDFDNPINPIVGISVQDAPTDDTSSDSSTTYMMIGVILVVGVGIAGFFFSRGRSDDEEYYYDDDDNYYDED